MSKKKESEETGIKLDEVIKRYTSNAEFERTHGNLRGCLDFRQLAEWLKDYKRLLEQEPKTGYWIKMPIGFKCSNCNELEDRTTKFCPNCGVKMVEPQESDIPIMYYPQVEGITPTVFRAEKEHRKGALMTKEQKDKILKAIAEDRNDYARDCNRRIAEENGKITGADYMLQRFLDVLTTEVEPQESEGT